MSTSNHTINGTVAAIQYTGANVADIQTALGSGYYIYVNNTTSIIAPCQVGNEMLSLNGSAVVHSGDWLVSGPAYGTNTPTLTNGFSVMTNAQFTRQYT